MSLLDKEHIIDDEANNELLIQYLQNNRWFKVHISDVSLEGEFYEKLILIYIVKLRIYYDWYYNRYRYDLNIQNCSMDSVCGMNVHKAVLYNIPVESEKIWDVLENLENILQELK